MALASQSLARKAQAVPAQPLPKAVVRREMAIRGERSKAAAHAHAAKQGAANSRQAAPNSSEMPRARLAGLQPKDNAAPDSEPARAKIVDPQPASSAADTSEFAQARMADSHPTDHDAAASNTRTLRDQVTAATAGAERTSRPPPAPPPQHAHSERSR